MSIAKLVVNFVVAQFVAQCEVFCVQEDGEGWRGCRRWIGMGVERGDREGRSSEGEEGTELEILFLRAETEIILQVARRVFVHLSLKSCHVCQALVARCF